MSYPHLSKTFSQHEPITLERYIILQKVEKIKELIDSDVAISLLGISKPTLLSYRKHGIVQAYKLGRKIRYRRAEILSAAKAIIYKK